MSGQDPRNGRKNGRVALFAALFAVGMVGMAFAAVPLYRVFCQVTGFNGTPQEAAAEAGVEVIDRDITIRFTSSKSPELPWEFEPQQNEATVKLGETGLAFYRAKNLSDEPVTGTAIYNVSPPRIGQYFVKIDCFCFTEQTLQPGQEVDMPVTFYVDPELAEDRNVNDVKSITLSYTFYRKEREDEPSGQISLLSDGDQ